MYDSVLPDIPGAIEKWVQQKAAHFRTLYSPALLEMTGGVEGIRRRAQHALADLERTPRRRLAVMVRYWIEIIGDPEDTEDEILLGRLREIKAVLDAGEVARAFDLLRVINNPRPDDPPNVGWAVPEPLDVTSAYWLDLPEPSR